MSFYHEKGLFWRVYKADFGLRLGIEAPEKEEKNLAEK